MSWLEKLGLVEVEEPVEPVFVPVDDEPVQKVEATLSGTEGIVEEIYNQNGMSDRSNSIYIVKALMNTLPEEMTTAKKQSTVAGILAVQGISVEALIEDAKDRAVVLEIAKDKVVGDHTYEIESNNAEIESLKQAIEAATIRIRNAESVISATESAVADEVKIIDTLIEFCAGMEG